MGEGRPVGVAGFGVTVIASSCPGLRFTFGPGQDVEERDGIEYKYRGTIGLL